MATLQEMMALDNQAEKTIDNSNFDEAQLRFGKWLAEEQNKNIPAGFKERFWAFFDNEAALTNLEPGDIEGLMADLRIAVLNYKMSIPDYSKDFNMLMSLDSLEAKWAIKLRRSTGGLMRERALQASQIRQVIGNVTETGGGKGGIINSIGSFFGGSRK